MAKVSENCTRDQFPSIAEIKTNELALPKPLLTVQAQAPLAELTPVPGCGSLDESNYRDQPFSLASVTGGGYTKSGEE